ncbi:MAG: T9SS type A sorting domain-containing protein [Crocinitomicaceae bacterium]|nr:T9SS type A sorting domain-containing protein [Flavobacteriales bacterium]NQZ36292.1 T9SS type A sorting domain-containing protein [Crocinitomicaceae bacterium]
MKTTLLSALFGIVSTFSFGQLSITIEGVPHTSGTVYTYASDTNTITINALVNNASGASMALTIKRVITSPVSSWKDDLCWGSSTNSLEGQCYNGIQATNPYTTFHTQTVDPGDNGIFLAKIKPKDPDYGCGDYKYYIIQNGSILLDSIEITVCKTVSIEEITPLSIIVAPNPANSYVKVKINGVDGATVKVVDVLGNVVLKETVMGTSKIINTESFRNGVYFVRVEAESQRPVTRKIIVRH